MKRIAAIVLLAGCMNSDPSEHTSNVQTGASPPTVFHSMWRGVAATAYFGDLMVGPVGGYVDIWEMGQMMGLSFSYLAADPTSQVCFTMGDYSFCYYTRYSYDSGGGPITLSDVTITPRTLVLNTAVGPGTNFLTTHCDVDYSAMLYQCMGGPAGTVSSRWTKDNAYSSFTSGTTHQVYGATTVHTNGIYWSSSATATGSILGHPFGSTQGYMSETRNNTVTKDVTIGGGGMPDGGTM